MKNTLLNTAVNNLNVFMRDASLDANESFGLEMNSSGEITVKGCKDINSFCDTGVMIISEEYYIDVKGYALQIKQFSPLVTIISGNITDISFMKR